MNCPRCGKAFGKLGNFCIHCGVALEPGLVFLVGSSLLVVLAAVVLAGRMPPSWGEAVEVVKSVFGAALWAAMGFLFGVSVRSLRVALRAALLAGAAAFLGEFIFFMKGWGSSLALSLVFKMLLGLSLGLAYFAAARHRKLFLYMAAAAVVAAFPSALLKWALEFLSAPGLASDSVVGWVVAPLTAAAQEAVAVGGVAYGLAVGLSREREGGYWGKAYCLKCGVGNPAEAQFCKDCGTSFGPRP
ncbi:MAG: zinc ribbon domain-containing protein [Elusimicrobia bacterium]|nr:zinc ribbon domain-containing protein [Elusimicrobiota bacterium]